MKNILLAAALVCSLHTVGQNPKQPVDTMFTDYDAIFSELDLFLDALTSRRSFALFNTGLQSNSFVKTDSSGTSKKLTVTPSLSYYHKSGLGISGEASIINDGQRISPFQFALSGFYDYVKTRNFMSGVSLTHYFTKAGFPFVSSPLTNEATAYFSYMRTRLRPTVSISYGWGTGEEYATYEEANKNKSTTQTISTQKRYSDLTISSGVRSTYYLENVVSDNDYLSFSPQVMLISGTRRVGIHQLSNTYTTRGQSGKAPVFHTDNTVTNDNMNFQPLSMMALLKTEYAKGKFYLQPQLVFDYYFPAENDKLTAGFILNAGFLF